MPDENEIILPYSSIEESQDEGRFIEELRAQSLQAFPDPDEWLTAELEKNIFLTTVDAVMGWARSRSVWPVFMGLACCAFEMIAAAGPRWDQARFGMEVLRASPRQADLLIASGTLTWKMAPAVKRVYDQMAEPKWVIAMGSCATSGGTFSESYSVVPGVNRIIPVDVYVPGCPPRPEGLQYGYMQLHEKIKRLSLKDELHLPRLD